MSLTHGSLFAGIGGFDLGFDRAGIETIWQVEIDDYCNRVLAKHWPNTKRYKDVRECGKHDLEPVDIISGGFPCQPFSAAGKRRGAADDRNLWPEFKRIIAEVRPRWTVIENVPGLRTLYLDTMLSDLARLGYAYETVVIPACAFDAPHRRERPFIVAYTEERGFDSGGRLRPEGSERKWGGRFSNGSEDVAYSSEAEREQVDVQSIGGYGPGGRGGGGRNTKSGVVGMVNGISSGLDRDRGISTWEPEPGISRTVGYQRGGRLRVRALGNAVVPRVAEFIGGLIVEIEETRK